MKGQSKRASLLESIINVLVGYWVAFTAQLLVFPLFGIEVSTGQQMIIAAIFTVISIVRSYLLRRLFNLFTIKKS